MIDAISTIDVWILHALNGLNGNWVVDRSIDFVAVNNLL